MKHYKVIASGKNFSKAVKFLREDCSGKFDSRTKSWAVEAPPAWLTWERMTGIDGIQEINFQQATRNWVHQEMDKANSDL